MADKSLVEKTLKQINSLTKKLEDFLSPQDHHAKKYRECTKKLYDFNLSCEDSRYISKQALPELVVNNFDEEQIWQELELNNGPDVANFLTSVSQLVAGQKSLCFNVKKSSKVKNKAVKNDVFDNTVNNEEESEDSEIDTEISNYKSQLNNDDESGSEDEIDFDFSAVDVGSEEAETDEDILKQGEQYKKEKPTSSISKSKSSQKSSIVDDEFFKLSQLEEFLHEQESRDEKMRRRDEGEDGDDDDDIDMYEDIEEEEGEDARNAMYSDFFDGKEELGEEKHVSFKEPEDDGDLDEDGEMENEEEDEDEMDEEEDDDDEEVEEEEEEEDDKEEKDFKALMKTKDKNNLLKDNDESDGEDVTDILGGKREKEETKSSFEIRQSKLKAQINKLELANLSTKSWQMSGEVDGRFRPENSLLEEHLQFDHTTKMTPVITEETTKSIEDIILQRIKDKAWDDVERKVKPTENTTEYKKRIVLDQEKSKQSLAQIYEEEYLKQQKKDKEDEEEEEKDPEREAIRTMMQSLFVKLDALSNFQYTPKQIQPELRVISNLPSIAMEEVAPVSKSDAQLIAPEEIKAKTKSELKGDTEKTDTDRKRARREKKAEKRTKVREKIKREKLVEKMNPGLGNKYSKNSALKELEKSSKITKNDVTVIKSDRKKSALGSSTLFFKQLQEEVKTQVLSRKAEKLKKRNEDLKLNTSKKLKL